ncbi:MAG: FAD-dependent monooxygenase, partial [Nocardioides sp.]
LAEIVGLAKRVVGTDYGMHDARWMSRFHSDERQVRRYRVGRVFLAGDAAHVHSPAGGMGMNTGMQDAANLSWKLAAVVKDGAEDQLLDTYHDERHPVGKMVLRTSGGLIRAALLRREPARAARDAAAAIAFRLPRVSRRLARRVSGLDIAYPPSAGSHRPVGTRAEDVVGTDGRRLYEVLRSARCVLVAPPTFIPGRLHGHVDVLHLVNGEARLVRPDGYVAWAGDDTDSLRTALGYWGAFGPSERDRA